MIIYKAVNRQNGKAYIGQTIRPISVRWAYHCSRHTKCSALKNAILKYGRESFDVLVIATAKSLDELNQLEEQFIKEHGTMSPRGYNLHGGGCNRIPSEETRKKLTASQLGNKKNLGKKQSEETKRKIGQAQVGIKNHAYGKPCVSRKAVICSNGMMFSSVREAGEATGIRSASISRVCLGQRSLVHGLKFRFIKKFEQLAFTGY